MTSRATIIRDRLNMPQFSTGGFVSPAGVVASVYSVAARRIARILIVVAFAVIKELVNHIFSTIADLVSESYSRIFEDRRFPSSGSPKPTFNAGYLLPSSPEVRILNELVSGIWL